MRSVLGRVVAGEFAEGQLLPREVDLAERLGVSRGVAREVLRALEERGVVSVKHGRGATVMPLERWNVLDPLVVEALLPGPDGRDVLLELNECRSLLEVGAAGFAAQRATEAQRVRIEHAMDRLASTPGRDHAARGSAELALHRSLVAASGNLSMAAMIRPVFDGLEAAAAMLGRRATSEQEHRLIVGAIATHDTDTAERAMREHLDAVATDLRRRSGRLLNR
jgi:GntR family transcriptional repressor for pyruvate dehydrogenase complex